MSVSGSRKENDVKNQFLDQETDKKTSGSGSRNWRFLSVSFLDPETDIMDQFLGPETNIMGEVNFMLGGTLPGGIEGTLG